MKTRTNKKGFTLIELMVVVAIIGILAAIAVPSFMAYRKRSYDKHAQTVLKNICSAQSMYNAKFETYTTNNVLIRVVDPNIPVSNAAMITWGVTTATTSGFTATATHNRGTGTTYIANQAAVITIL